MAFAAVSKGNHYNTLSSVGANPPSIVTNDSPAFDFPIAPKKMQICPTDATSLELNKNLCAPNHWFGYVFSLNVAGSTIDDGFQKSKHSKIIEEKSTLLRLCKFARRVCHARYYKEVESFRRAAISRKFSTGESSEDFSC